MFFAPTATERDITAKTVDRDIVIAHLLTREQNKREPHVEELH